MLNYNIQTYGRFYRMEHSDAMGGVQLGLKRFFDIVFAVLGLIILSPLILIFSAILFYDKGPVIFKQERIGYRGKPFMIYKFRIMRTDAESDGIPRLETERNKYLTSFGGFLRAHHLDEIPQLFDVLTCNQLTKSCSLFVIQCSQLRDTYMWEVLRSES